MEGWWVASYVVLWGLVVGLSIVVVALARQIGTLHLRLGPRGALEVDDEGPPLGEAPPRILTTDVNGHPVAVGGPGRPQMLLFVSPGCRICEQVLPGLHAASAYEPFRPVVITDVDAHESKRDAVISATPATIVPGLDVAQAYEVPGTPYVVILDGLGVVRSKGTINNLEQFEGLVDTARRRMEPGEVVEAG